MNFWRRKTANRMKFMMNRQAERHSPPNNVNDDQVFVSIDPEKKQICNGTQIENAFEKDTGATETKRLNSSSPHLKTPVPSVIQDQCLEMGQQEGQTDFREDGSQLTAISQIKEINAVQDENYNKNFKEPLMEMTIRNRDESKIRNLLGRETQVDMRPEKRKLKVIQP